MSCVDNCRTVSSQHCSKNLWIWLKKSSVVNWRVFAIHCLLAHWLWWSMATVLLYPMLFSFTKLYTDTIFMLMPQKCYIVADLLTCKRVTIESFFKFLVLCLEFLLNKCYYNPVSILNLLPVIRDGLIWLGLVSPGAVTHGVVTPLVGPCPIS